MKHSIWIALASVALLTAAAPSRDTMVLVVRHAEKAGPTGDVPLSAEGEARAKALTEIAREAGVSAVITTQFLRTRQTAAPYAQVAGITPVQVNAGSNTSEHAASIATSIREGYAGQVVLVVGHSNTVPAIVAALGGARDSDICDSEYDRLYVLSVSVEGTRVVKARYGAPSPPDPACAAMR